MSDRSQRMRPLILLLFPTTLAAVHPEVIPGGGVPWPRHTIDAGSRGADGVKLGDFNGDGRPDLVTGWEEGGVVRAYANPGPQRVRSPWPQVTLGTAPNVEEAIFADLDGDGRLDGVSGTEGKTRRLFWHRRTSDDPLSAEAWQTLPLPAPKRMWMQAAALQVDGEHGPDLVLAAKGEGAAIGWLQAPAQPLNLAEWRWQPLREAGWVMSLLPHDVDGDGNTDLLCTDRKGPRRGVFWLKNPGTKQVRAQAPWIEHPLGGSDREVMFADLGDLDGDGLTDVAVAAKPRDVLMFLRRADGGWRNVVLSLVADRLGDAKAVKIGDLNGDGLADLVFTCENAHGKSEGVVWLEQHKGGAWRQHSLGGPDGVKFDLVQLLDLDADGDLDVITCEERDQLGVIWYENPAIAR